MENLPKPTTTTIIYAAADLIAKNGWQRGSTYSPDQMERGTPARHARVCVSGAILTAARNVSCTDWEAIYAQRDMGRWLRETARVDHSQVSDAYALMKWNDHYAHSTAEIVCTLEAFAAHTLSTATDQAASRQPGQLPERSQRGQPFSAPRGRPIRSRNSQEVA